MTDCECVLENLVDYLEGSLSDSEKQEIETHLEECLDCREELAFLRVLFEDAPCAAVSAPPSIRLGVMEKIRAQSYENTERDFSVPIVNEATEIAILETSVEAAEVLTTKYTEDKSEKTISFSKLFANKRFAAGLVAACLLVVAIPIYSAIKPMTKSQEPESDMLLDSGANIEPKAAPFLASGENVIGAKNSAPYELNESGENAKEEVDGGAVAETPIGASAAAERTPREVVVDFSETSVRYFNEFIPSEDYDLYSFIMTVGKENVIETNLKYYFCLNDELYNMLLNQMTNKSQIVPFDTDTLKLDPLAKKGIIVVKK